MKKILIFLFTFLLLTQKASSNKDEELYKKIDLFGEVLDKIKNEYVDEVDQAETMDSAINGVLQSLDPYSAYMSPELFKSMQTETKGEFGGLGIEIGMEAGLVKVISPIADTPAEKAGIKAGDYIVQIGSEQVSTSILVHIEEKCSPERNILSFWLDATSKRTSLIFPLPHRQWLASHEGSRSSPVSVVTISFTGGCKVNSHIF